MQPKVLLEVVSASQNRTVVPIAGEDPNGPAEALATGHTRTSMVVRTATGHHWLVSIPNEMYEDLLPLQPGLDVRDDVVASRDKNPAAAE